MYKIIFILVLSFNVVSSAASAETMRNFRDDFLVCKQMLTDAGPQIRQILWNLHNSSMSIDVNGWVNSGIVDRAENSINYYMDTWQHNYFVRTNNDPIICKQEVNDLINYVQVETQKVMSKR